ncbi:MAG: putative toxin-antitoxin system toxin component, PIN family [Acidobacteriia bacterium]|nr:putative toxin-antitoxin system toxin component, PIN family [Terriglobia bacterium]
MRIVLDTNVLARAHQLAHGPARRLLLRIIAGPDVLILSPYLLLELERILVYPRMLKQSGLSRFDIAEYVECLARVSTLVDPAPVLEGVLRDRGDEPVLGTALAGRAEVLCTRDADFFTEPAQRWSAAQGIRILTDLELLRALL